ncbi:hypothetical protein T484DRAFT_2081670 [Baffinella frigidus]|nr:hypothetical protein T484DRAFT_2081670 [Cryptophyta sp. CCMP2293]
MVVTMASPRRSNRMSTAKLATAMHDARRGPTSMLAYSEFLEGMALISQQEYLSPDHTGENANSFQDEMLNAMPTKERKQKLKKLATWERTIRQRNQAQTTATFAKNLERRVHMDRGTPVEKCSKGHLPIRGETRDILIRPLEADFSAFGAIMYLVSIGICVFNIYIQITTIRGVCSAAFTCPRLVNSVNF